MMNRFAPAALTVAILTLCAPGSAAAVEDSFESNLGIGVSQDERAFLGITNDYFRPPRKVATAIVRGSHRPEDDYPTILFLARASRRPAEEILRLRHEELSWADMMPRLKVPPSVLFAGLTREPGPPYGRAWGHYKRQPGKGKLILTDREVVELVKLQITAGHFRVSPLAVAAERKKGVKIERYAAERQRARHTKAGAKRKADRD